MSLTKRGKTWHTQFFVDGQRFRRSLETSDWREAQKKEKELIAHASQGKLATGTQQFAKLSFAEAAQKNLAERMAHLAPRSVQIERERLKPLCAVFGAVKVSRITIEMVRTYAADRKAANVANKTINLEIGVLRSVMKRAKLWHLFAEEVKPLPVHTQIGRAMTSDEKLRLTRCQGRSKTRPVWRSKSRPVDSRWLLWDFGVEGRWSVAEEALLPRGALGIGSSVLRMGFVCGGSA